jgi:hypothetical protein
MFTYNVEKFALIKDNAKEYYPTERKIEYKITTGFWREAWLRLSCQKEHNHRK